MILGMAFFLTGCQPKTIPEKAVEKPTGPDHFSLGEQNFQRGLYDKALEDYQRHLVLHPRGEQAPRSLYRIAKIYYKKSLYGKALQHYTRIMREYPDLPETPEIQFDMAHIHYRLGNYEESSLLSSQWIKKYPTHPLRGEILILIGRNKRALGDNPEAFFWWHKASKEMDDSPQMREKMVERIITLIQGALIDELKEMAVYAEGSPYAPQVYHRMTTLYLEADKLKEAKGAAMALVRSTTEQKWVSIGRQILERIEEELSVKAGAIGCLLPLSGPFAIYGQEVLNGIQLGMGIFSEAQGGVEVELIIKDTSGKEAEAVKHVEELAEKGKVIAIIGPLASRPATAAAKRSQELGIPIITLTQKDRITDEGEMVFRNFLTPVKEISRVLDMTMNEMAWDSFGILYPENSYGQFLMNLFWDKVEELGGNITAVESYRPDATDFAIEIKKMVGLHYPRPESVKLLLREMKTVETDEDMEEVPELDQEEEPEPIVDFDAVFIPDNYQQVALIAPQFPFHNVFDVRFLGTNLWQSEKLIELAGKYVQGAIFPSGFFRSGVTGPVEDFVAMYEKNFEDEPGILAATGYDTMMFLKNLIKKRVIKTRKGFQKALLEADPYPGLTGNMSFDQYGDVVKDPVLLTVSGQHLYEHP